MPQKAKQLKLKTPKKAGKAETAHAEPLTETLNAAQKEAVLFGDGPLLIIAGAGTGKTTAMTRRIARLIGQGVAPDNILALTFTDKAATEMEERVDLLLPYGYYDLWISTFHAFCERVLKQHALDIGVPNDFKVLDGTQQKILVRKNIEAFNLDYYRPLGNPTKFVNELVKHFSKAKDEEISPEQYLEYAQNIRLNADSPDFIKNNPDLDGDAESDGDEIKRVGEIANAYHVYQKLLLEHNALDFGDLINYTLRLFRTRKKLLKFYQDKFKFILVDEFQDTNFAQYELVKMLAAPRNNLNVVGDDDQSIYKFRGASVSNILKFKEDFPQAREITLNENYRSAQNILDMAYNFIQANNPERLETKLAISKKLRANSRESGRIEVISGQALTDEVDMVIKKILEIKKADSANWNDFAILVRANDQADAFISKLAQLGLPYTYYANKGLYKKPIILDLVYYMRLLVNAHESNFLYRVLALEPFQFAEQDLATILNYANKHTLSLFEALQLAPTIPTLAKETQKKIQDLLGLLSAHSKLAMDTGAVEVFITVVKDLRIDKRVEADTIENMENREVLEQFYKKIEAFETESEDKSIKAFLDALALEQESGEEGKLNFDPNQGPESIKIMTIHSSKGLEFANVFVVNMVHLRFPSTDRKDGIELPTALVKEILPEGDVHLQEERRLFYVAMTRAKKGLFFSYASDYGGARTRKPSPFLVDVGLVAKPEKSTEILRKEKKIESNYDLSAFLPAAFSYSQISDFRRCPLEYKYKYWLHLPTKGSAQLSFGNTMHATLQKFLAQYKSNLEMTQLDLFESASKAGAKPKLPEYKELLDFYEKSWVDEWYASKIQKKEYRDKGQEILKTFYEQFRQNPTTPKFLERKFTLKLGEFTISGRIDRADIGDGGLEIIDYKTGKTKLEKKDHGLDQLYIYQWAAQEFLGEKVIGSRYLYLLDGTLSESRLASEADIELLKADLLETIGEIRHAAAHNLFREFHDKSPQHTCQFEELE